MSTMRAKMQVSQVLEHLLGQNGEKTGETLSMIAVAAKSYSSDGLDEDNTFAKWTPAASMAMTINNPALWGKFSVGQRFYVDFTEAPDSPPDHHPV